MKRDVVIIVLKAEHSDLEINPFLKVAWLFVVKVHEQLETADRDSAEVAKCQTPAK